MMRVVVASVLVLGLAGVAAAQPAPPQKPPEMQESCPAMISSTAPRVVPAALKEGEVRISYVGHSTFQIDSPRGVRAATDYNDYVRPSALPTIITMNRAHSTHYTDAPDPGIRFVLRGWKDDGRPTDHDVNVLDVRVRSVATNIRDYAGGTQRHGNSIFIFEVANLCIAHLGHLHHTLTQQQLDAIGGVDVVMVPVDGGATLDLEGMMEVLTALKPKLMIPMHFFSSYTLDRFLARAREQWEVQWNEVPSIVLSKHNLPPQPRVLVLPGGR
jgi:L-ascorbate metabolism protein UlaG (beta-lactamase superfamily)